MITRVHKYQSLWRANQIELQKWESGRYGLTKLNALVTFVDVLEVEKR
jgi:hypothetical protein